jgi:hypothetical protein
MEELDEENVARVLRDYVVGTLPLGVYDPHQPRRSRVPVVSFEVEFLDVDEDGNVCAAGPVVLETGRGEVEYHLRVTAPMVVVNGECRVADPAAVRAVYIVLVNGENGSCKETAALANA